MRILFVYRLTTWDLTEPLGIMSISSYLKEHGHECELLIPNFEKNFLEKIVEYKPDVVGYSCTSGMEDYYLKLNRELKRKIDFFSIFGGSHPTYFPDVIDEESVDAVCVGEGEQATLDLVSRVENNEDVSGIKNLWVKDADSIVHKNELRPLVEDLDSLPFPDREILYKYPAYRDYGLRFFLTSRGCPYNCSYCFNHTLRNMYAGKGRYVRQRSVDNVIEEINEVRRRYKMTHVTFSDDILTLNKEWMKEFSMKYKKEVGLPFNCYVRANLIDEEMAEYLKRAGCYFASMGIESGNPEIRDRILNRNMTDEQILKAARLIKKQKIRLMGQNMLGFPGETIDDVFATIRLNTKCGVDYAWVSILQPYPKTEIYEICQKKNLIDDESQNLPSYQWKSILKLKNKREIENLHTLFAITVELPFLVPLIRRLIRLPKNVFYRIPYYLFKSYAYYFRLKMSLLDKGTIRYLAARVFERI